MQSCEWLKDTEMKPLSRLLDVFNKCTSCSDSAWCKVLNVPKTLPDSWTSTAQNNRKPKFCRTYWNTSADVFGHWQMEELYNINVSATANQTKPLGTSRLDNTGSASRPWHPASLPPTTPKPSKQHVHRNTSFPFWYLNKISTYRQLNTWPHVSFKEVLHLFRCNHVSNNL